LNGYHEDDRGISRMNVSTHSGVAVYTVAGTSTARELPEWLIRKRKRSLKKDPEYANRVELLQDFEFPEASSCIRVSEDGNWVMSTGTYKPQIHTHYLPNLALSFARHTDALNLKFVILSQDISKSLHLQTDRYLEFHKQGGMHHRLRIPRYGRDLAFNRREAEALVPTVGANAEGLGEVFRLNLELGRFMKPYEVDIGGDRSAAVDGALQGGVDTGRVNAAAVAEKSHNLLGFGTSIGTVEFWDPRCHASVGTLGIPRATLDGSVSEVTALQFQRGGITVAAGDSNGITYLYDLRSPTPVQKKDQGYGFPIKCIKFLDSPASQPQASEPKILSADKRGMKIWDRRTAKTWSWVEPSVELNDVEWVPDSGMFLTANEGRQQHAFFIPQLGPAPKWCSFLDNIVEEMAEDANDPHAYGLTAGAIYDNYKFLTMPQLKTLNIDHLVGKSGLLRPYMHGYFVSQKLYEEASFISNPTFWEEQRAKKIKEKIEKARESRIRGRKKIQVKQNRLLVERILEREEKNERRKAKRALENGGDVPANGEAEKKDRPTLLSDSRFSALFQDEDFVIDEDSREFNEHNPVRKPSSIPKGLTAVDEEEMDQANGHYDDDDTSDESDGDEEPQQERQAKAVPSFKQKPKPPKMVIKNSMARDVGAPRKKSFEARLSKLKGSRRDLPDESTTKITATERSITFVPRKKHNGTAPSQHEAPAQRVTKNGRRRASGNAFRGM
jgi:ribosome biogenesis protein ENP2